MFRRGNRPQELIATHSKWRFTRPVARSDHFIPGTLVVCSDGLFDRRVLNNNKAPMLHVAAARAAHTCLQNLPDQRLWHRVRLQSPHRAGCLDNFEQIGGARELHYHGSLLAVNCLDANRLTSLLRSCSLVGTPAMVRLWQDKNESG